MAAPAGFAAFARQRLIHKPGANCHRRAEHWGIRRAESARLLFLDARGGGSRDYLWGVGSDQPAVSDKFSIRPMGARSMDPKGGEPAEATAEEQALARRARELQKQAKKLQEEVDRSGLGADLKPVPEPTVRDLSVAQARPGRSKKAAEPVRSLDPADEGEVIPARGSRGGDQR